MQNEKENRYVFEMTLDYDDPVRDLGASNATLLMRAYLVRENYNNNTTLDGDAVFHETTVREETHATNRRTVVFL